jgi:hypothetical protein
MAPVKPVSESAPAMPPLPLSQLKPPDITVQIRSSSDEAEARDATFQKQEAWQMLGVRFFKAEEVVRRGALGHLNDHGAVVASIDPDGPLNGLLERGEMLATVDGAQMHGPEQVSTTLRRHDAGDVTLGVLPPPAGLDLTIDPFELPAPASPRRADGNLIRDVNELAQFEASSPRMSPRWAEAGSQSPRWGAPLMSPHGVMTPRTPRAGSGFGMDQQPPLPALDLEGLAAANAKASPRTPRTPLQRVLNSPRALATGVAKTVSAPVRLYRDVSHALSVVGIH